MHVYLSTSKAACFEMQQKLAGYEEISRETSRESIHQNLRAVVILQVKHFHFNVLRDEFINCVMSLRGKPSTLAFAS